jgi:flagellar hook-associated protein 2
MDTDELVTSLMKIEQIKLDRKNSALTLLTWKQEAYSEVSSLLRDFKNNFTSVMGADSLMKESAYNAYTISTTGSGASAVTLTPSVYASAGSITISSVTSLAKGASYTSAAAVSKGDGLTASTKLDDLDLKEKLTFDADGKISFSINGTSFTFSKDDTLGKMINTVNASDAGVTMSYSQITDKFSIETKAKGSAQTESALSIVNITGNAFADDGAFGINSATTAAIGTSAKITINENSIERDSNTFTLDGITYTLNRTTADTGEEIYATVKKDVSLVVDNVKKFVEGYNTLIKKLEDLVSTRKSSGETSYVPLTDEEKSVLTEEQIKSYEAIAKKGVIYGDTGIKRLLTNMRAAMYETVQSAGLSPAAIGIKTGSYFESGKGEIVLDEDRLRAALERDPQQVMDVIAGSEGFLSRVSSFIDTYNLGSGASNLTALQNKLSSASDDIAAFEEKMAALEEKYYLKFAAMEEALSKMNEQTSWLSSLMGQES